MTSEFAPDGGCPACGADLTESSPESMATFCPECGLVPANAAPEKPLQSEPSKGAAASSEMADDWREYVEVSDSSDAQLVRALSVTEAAADSLALDSAVRAVAAEVVVDAWREGSTHGRALESVVAAAVYLACRDCPRTRPMAAIADGLGVSKSAASSSYRALLEDLDIEQSPVRPADYVSYICQAVAEGRFVDAARSLLEDANVSGGNPAGIAAGSVYIVAHRHDHNLTYRTLGESVGLTKETVWRQTDRLRGDEL